MLWAWITEGDGFIILVCSWNVLVLVFVILWVHNTSLRVMRCEVRIDGFNDRVRGIHEHATKVGHELRRVTGSFDKIVDEELAGAATRIRDRVKPKELEDAD